MQETRNITLSQASRVGGPIHPLLLICSAMCLLTASNPCTAPLPPLLGCRLANWAMFFPNLSLSACSILTFRFIEPGRVLRLLCLTFVCLNNALLTSPPAPPASPTSGRASASDWRLVTSFLFGRRRVFFFPVLFSILLTKAECLTVRLSLFVLEKVTELAG